MRTLTHTQTDTLTWAGDTTIAGDLEREGLATRYDFTAEITPSATLTAANQPDSLGRVLANLQIVGSSKTYFNLPSIDGGQGGTLLHHINRLDGFGIGHPDGAIANPPSQLNLTPMTWTFHCGSRPRDKYGRDQPFDLTGFIPAGVEGQLRINWTTNTNDVMDDTVTISSAVGRITAHRVVGTEDDIKGLMAMQEIHGFPMGANGPANGMIPVWSATLNANSQTTTDYDSEQIDLIGGAWLKRLLFLCQDATGDRPLRAGDEVTRVNIRSAEASEEVYRSWLDRVTASLPPGDMLTADSGAAVNAAVATPIGVDFNLAAPQGVYFIDLRGRAGPGVPLSPDYGWNLRGVRTGQLTMGLYITTRADGDDTLVIQERMEPYDGPLTRAGIGIS